MTEVKIPLGELFWSRWREGWGDGVPYDKLSERQRAEIESGVQAVADAVREELSAAVGGQALTTLRLVDRRCGHKNCESRGGYRMVGGCYNCGAGPLLGLFTATHPATGGDCPVCGCARLHWDRLATADEIPAPSETAASAPERPMLGLYREALERLADEDTPVLGEGLGGGAQEELHVRASFAAHTLGRDTCGCTECIVSLGLDPDAEDADDRDPTGVRLP